MQIQVHSGAPDAGLETVELRSLDCCSQTFESEHYVFHCKPGSKAETEIESICAYQEACFSHILKTLAIPFSDRIHYYFLESPKEAGAVLAELCGDGAPTNGAAVRPHSVFAVYNDEIKGIGAHEDTHLVSYAFCIPESAFLREGLAMFLDETWWGRPNREWARDFVAAGSYRSVFALDADAVFFSVPCEITYPIAGAFTQYLAEQIGVRNYLEKVYRPQGALSEKLRVLLHAEPDAIERDFKVWL